MKIEELNPFPKSKVHFVLSSFKAVPKDSGCYVLTTFDDQILYIGLSDNLYERFKQHLDNPNKTQATKEGRAIWFYFMTYDSRKLEQLERTWLNHHTIIHGRRPILNKVDSPIS